ncbi:MAG TPA: type II toxin-antitoxin system prevent-host-death family antitoxin [Chloroflexi bacterium]|nr:type II toxin-antitoxin system prevent-host-death family antitoxin [Chloroflexota bacterium]
MSYRVGIEEAKALLSELIEAAVRGENVVIIKDNSSGVRLVPVKLRERRPQFGSAKGLIEISENFDAPL